MKEKELQMVYFLRNVRVFREHTHIVKACVVGTGRYVASHFAILSNFCLVNLDWQAREVDGVGSL